MKDQGMATARLVQLVTITGLFLVAPFALNLGPARMRF
jgi:hypothetical protein